MDTALEDTPPTLTLNKVATHPTTWDPSSVAVTMNLRMDGCIVPSESQGARVSYSHLLVLDNFIDDGTREELRGFLVGAMPGSIPEALPEDRWERRTADMAGGSATWGVKAHVIEAMAGGRPPAILEVQSRLAKLYPEWDIVHLPSAAIQGSGGDGDDSKAGDTLLSRSSNISSNNSNSKVSLNDADCSAFLANAAVKGDTFRYHVDADPTSFPPSPWTLTFGDYFNGEPGKPLLVSLLLYLDKEWDRDWAADTLFLDAGTDTGVMIRPRAGRAVLMHQDVLHRVSAPSAVAEGRPRLSLVWKLAFIPRSAGQACSIGRQEWGPPVAFGSAAKVEAVKRQLAQERRTQDRQ